MSRELLSGAWMPLRTTAVAVAAASAAFAWAGPKDALPSGASAVFGGVQVREVGKSLFVTTTNGAGANHSVVDWRSFSIGKDHMTVIQQPNAASTSINRVTGDKPSEIMGSLVSNGRVVLVNPSGITVGRDAVVDTAGFTAAAMELDRDDARIGRLDFGRVGDKKDGKVRVDGQVIARNGDVVLIGSEVKVEKHAVVQANGSIILAAGQEVELTGRGLEGITLRVTAPQDRAENMGRLEGDAVGIFASRLKHSGLIKADTVKLVQGGVVLLDRRPAGGSTGGGTGGSTGGDSGGNTGGNTGGDTGTGGSTGGGTGSGGDGSAECASAICGQVEQPTAGGSSGPQANNQQVPPDSGNRDDMVQAIDNGLILTAQLTSLTVPAPDLKDEKTTVRQPAAKSEDLVCPR